MGFSSMSHWVIVALVLAVVFGAGKLPGMAADLAKGIKNFKAGMKDDDMPVIVATSSSGKRGLEQHG